MFVASHLSGVKTPIQFWPLKSDRAPIQFMPLSMPKSDLSSCYRPIFIGMQRSMMPDHSSSLRLRCKAIKYDDVVESQNSDGTPNGNEFNCVIKFGSSSVDSANGMIEIVKYICILDRTIRSFEERRLRIVISAMGETTKKLVSAAKKAVSCDISSVPDIEEWTYIKDLHLRTADELGIDREIVSEHLLDLEQILIMIAKMKKISRLTKEHLDSVGVSMSTKIFAAYLNKIGVQFKQCKSHVIDIITTHDLTNVDIVEATYPSDWINDPAIPNINSSLGKDRDGTIVWNRNATMLDITRMFCQFIRLSKVYTLMFLQRVERVVDDWLSTF